MLCTPLSARRKMLCACRFMTSFSLVAFLHCISCTTPMCANSLDNCGGFFFRRKVADITLLLWLLLLLFFLPKMQDLLGFITKLTISTCKPFPLALDYSTPLSLGLQPSYLSFNTHDTDMPFSLHFLPFGHPTLQLSICISFYPPPHWFASRRC